MHISTHGNRQSFPSKLQQLIGLIEESFDLKKKLTELIGKKLDTPSESICFIRDRFIHFKQFFCSAHCTWTLIQDLPIRYLGPEHKQSYDRANYVKHQIDFANASKLSFLLVFAFYFMKIYIYFSVWRCIFNILYSNA